MGVKSKCAWRGRAGRARPGHCLKLYTRRMLENSRIKAQKCIVYLERLCLWFVVGAWKTKIIFGQVIEPPNSESVVSAEAFEGTESIWCKSRTDTIRYHLASMSVDAQIGKCYYMGQYCVVRIKFTIALQCAHDRHF